MPGTYFGPGDGEQYSDYANGGNANLGRFPLGHTLILPDQREYKFTLNDTVTEVAGYLYQSVAPVAAHMDVLVTTPAAIAATAISGTMTATAAAIDIYTEGVVHVNKATGYGYSFRIKRAFTAGDAHAAAASTGTLTVNLETGETVQVALDTTTGVSFSRNRYHAVTIHPAPPTAQLAGVSPGVAAASRWYWSQTKGYAAVLANLTLLAGLPVQPDLATNGAVTSMKRRVQTSGTTVAGSAAAAAFVAVLDQDGTTSGLFIGCGTAGVTGIIDIGGGIAANAPPIGICVKANASTEFALINLNIP